MYFASGSKCGLSTPLTSGELADGGKLVLFIALHSSSLALGKDGLSLTGGVKKETERREERKVREETFKIIMGKKKKTRIYRPLAASVHASIRRRLAKAAEDNKYIL